MSAGSIHSDYQTIQLFADFPPFCHSVVNRAICVTSSKFVLTGLSHRFKCQEVITFTARSCTDTLQGHIPAQSEYSNGVRSSPSQQLLLPKESLRRCNLYLITTTTHVL